MRVPGVVDHARSHQRPKNGSPFRRGEAGTHEPRVQGVSRQIAASQRLRGSGQRLRPTQLVRMVGPLGGAPRIRVRCEPRLGWSKATPTTLRGSNHLAFEGFSSPLRLTTDLPLAYVGGQPFALSERRHLVLTWGAPIEEIRVVEVHVHEARK